MFKSHVENLIKSSMGNTEATVAMSMIYGDTTDLDESIKEDFEAVGVSHLMSVSGTHITSFMIIINWVFRINTKNDKNNKRKKNNRKNNIKIKCIIQIISICIYVIFTGFSVSVLRAGIMLIISIICDMLNKRKNKYKVIITALLIILVHSPYAIFNTGMRLSFFATLGIMMFAKHIAKMFEKVTLKIKNEIIKKVVDFLTENIAITISVQLVIIPIQIQSFNKLPFPVIIPNLILGLISTPIRVIGTIGIMLSFIPTLSSKIFSVLELLVKALLYFANIFKSVSFSISTVSMPFVFFVLYYIFILCIFGYFKLKNITNKEGKWNFRKLLKYLKRLTICLFLGIIITALLLNIYSIYFSEYIYFFNVEQGDMSYVKSGTKSVIVDIGSMRDGLAFNTISNYFKMSNLRFVDVIVISHMHKDHINGLENFLMQYDVGTVIYSEPKTKNETYINFKNMLKKYNVNTKEVKQGDVISVGNITIEVLLPGEEYVEGTDEVNANSLICKLTVNNKELLFMGDATKEAEDKLIKEKIDIDNIYILKVGHHGSKTSTSTTFIQKTKPKNAVISALKKYYGHPHEQTIETLEESKVYINITEKQGAIKFNLK